MAPNVQLELIGLGLDHMNTINTCQRETFLAQYSPKVHGWWYPCYNKSKYALPFGATLTYINIHTLLSFISLPDTASNTNTSGKQWCPWNGKGLPAYHFVSFTPGMCITRLPFLFLHLYHPCKKCQACEQTKWTFCCDISWLCHKPILYIAHEYTWTWHVWLILPKINNPAAMLAARRPWPSARTIRYPVGTKSDPNTAENTRRSSMGKASNILHDPISDTSCQKWLLLTGQSNTQSDPPCSQDDVPYTYTSFLQVVGMHQQRICLASTSWLVSTAQAPLFFFWDVISMNGSNMTSKRLTVHHLAWWHPWRDNTWMQL